MKVKLKILIIILLFQVCGLFAEQIVETDLFLFDRQVNDEFVGNYTIGSTPDLFSDFFAIDSIWDEDREIVYGVGADKDKNVIYYFDSKRKNEYYAINKDTGESALTLVDKVAVTEHGRIFAIDSIEEHIAWWNVGGELFNPAGTIEADFKNLEDICYDGSEYLYILDNVSQRLFKYSVNEGRFAEFSLQRKNYIDYGIFITSSWGRARGVTIADGSVYILFECGRIIRFNAEGKSTATFYMNRENINLVSHAGYPKRSTSWWTSITTGPHGNIYILDEKDLKVHVLSKDLEYICSWHDPEHPFDDTVSDISFCMPYRGLLICHDWGFFTYELAPKLSGVSCDSDTVYPDYLSEAYKGIEVTFSMIGTGSLDISLVDGSREIKLIDNYQMNGDGKYTYHWNGKDNAGIVCDPGEYVLKLYLNNRPVKDLSVKVGQSPALVVTPPADVIIQNPDEILEYSYYIDRDAHVKAYLNNSNSTYTINSANVSEGNYSCVISGDMLGSEAKDGSHYLHFEIIPIELYERGIGAKNIHDEQFVIDYESLEISDIELDSSKLNPQNEELMTINCSFSVNEDANVTVQIRNEEGSLVRTVYDNEEMGAGIQAVSWNGKDNNSASLPDGRYFFRISAGQPLTGAYLYEKSGIITMDTTPPKISITGPQDTYYISPNEASSIGIQDSVDMTVSLNESAVFSAEIRKAGTEPEKTLFTDIRLGSGATQTIRWDGRNDASEYSEDGIYKLFIQASDEYGNTIVGSRNVVVDNNNLAEDLEAETTLIAGEELKVFYTADAPPAIAAVGDGYVLASSESDTNSIGIYISRYSANGTQIGTKFRADDIGNHKLLPTISTIEDGFVVAWTAYEYYTRPDNTRYGVYRIYFRRFDMDCNPLGAEVPITHSQDVLMLYPHIIPLQNRFAIVWQQEDNIDGGYGIFGKLFANNGTPVSPSFQIDSNLRRSMDLKETTKTSDGFAVTWYSKEGSLSSGDICFRAFDYNGEPVGNETSIEKIDGFYRLYPDIAYTNDKLIISWFQGILNDPVVDLYAQSFSLDGTVESDPVRVNTDNVSNRFRKAAIASFDDGILITWLETKTSGYSISGRCFDSNLNSADDEFVIYDQNEADRNTSLDFIKKQDNNLLTWRVYNTDNSSSYFCTKEYELLSLDANNLTAKFLSPTGSYTGREDFQIKAYALDRNMDHYSLSVKNNEGEKVLLDETGKTVSGDMHWFNILDASELSENTVDLEVWDKAGNYRSDSFTLTRDHEDYITRFDLSSLYASENKSIKASFSLSRQCSAELAIENESGSIAKSFSLGSVSSLADYEINCSGLADGNYYLRLNVINNVDEFESRKMFIIDNTHPVPAIGDIALFYTDEEEADIPVSVSDDNPYTAALLLCDEEGTVIETLAEGSTSAEFENSFINPSRYEEGSYTLRLFAKDSADNTGTYEKTFIIDRTAPVLDLTSPDSGNAYGNIVHFNGKITDAGGLDNCGIYYQLPGEDPSIISSLSGSDINLDWSTSVLEKGIINCRILFVLQDRAGNIRNYEKDLIIDHNAPDVYLSYNEEPYLDAGGSRYINGQNKLFLSADSGDEYSDVALIRYRINGSDFILYSESVMLNNSGNYAFEYYAADTFGNSSDMQSLIINVDNSAPLCGMEVSIPKYEKDGHIFIPAENNISLFPEDDDSDICSGLMKCEYRNNDGVWQEYNNDISLVTDGVVTLRARTTDNVGNMFESIVGEFIVDLAPPLTGYEIDGTYYQSLQDGIIALSEPSVITLTAGDSGPVDFQSGLMGIYYTVDGTEHEYTNPFEISSEAPAEYKFYSRDNVGNEEYCDEVMIAVDKKIPEASCILPVNIYKSNGVIYAKGGSVFSLEATDNFSGVRQILYRFGSGDFSEYENPFSWEEETDITLQCYAEDNMGLLSAMGETNISIDNSAPHTELITSISLVVRDGVNYADARYLFSLHPIDAKSGVSHTVITVDGEEISDLAFALDTEGLHCIEYYSVDNLKHKETTNVLYVTTPISDITPPVSKLSSSASPYCGQNMDYYKSDVTFAISAEDAIGEFDSFASGLKCMMISIDGKSYTEYEAGNDVIYNEEGLHSISYYAEDLAGNTEQVQSYLFTIDDSAPVSKLGFDRNKVIEIDGVLQINESAVIEITAEDTYCGVAEIHYSTGDGEFSVYESPVSLGNGNYEFVWYAVDYLGNKECVHKQQIRIENDYNEIAFDTNYIRGVDDKIDDYDVYGDMIVYLRGKHSEHLYIKLIWGEDTNLWAYSKKLTAWKQDRIQVALGSEWAACVERRNGNRELFLYNLWDYHQYGFAVAVNGEPRDPLFLDGKLYWISADDIKQYINEYNPRTQETKILFETSGAIQALKKNSGILSLLINTDCGQKVYSYEDGAVICKFNWNEVKSVINDFSYDKDFLALESDDDNGKQEILLYHYPETSPELFDTVKGRMPVVDGSNVYWVKTVDEDDIVFMQNPVTGEDSYIIKAPEIKELRLTERNDLLVRRVNNYRAMNMFNNFFFHNNYHSGRNMNDYMNHYLSEDFIFLKTKDSDNLIGNIEYTSGNKDFAYNKFCDEEDFIYADETIVFPPYFGFEWELHQLQTFNKERAADGEVTVSFTALKDVTVYVITDSRNRSRFDERNRHRHHNRFHLMNDWRDRFLLLEMRFLSPFFRFDINTYELDAGEQLTLEELDSECSAPLILIRERK